MNRTIGALFLLPFLLLLSIGVSIAASSGFALRDTKIMEAPFRDAKVAGALKKGTTVEIVKRKGGWLQVTAGKSSGWVRMMTIRRGAPGGKPSAGTETKGVLGLASGRAGSGNVVATSGVRGLSEEELKEAEFDAREMRELESYTANKREAGSFAREAGLETQKVEFLKSPKRK